MLKDEIATTEEVKRAELSAKLSEDLDGKAAALESKVEDADAKAKALETQLADVENKLADEASSRAAAVAELRPARGSSPAQSSASSGFAISSFAMSFIVLAVDGSRRRSTRRHGEWWLFNWHGALLLQLVGKR